MLLGSRDFVARAHRYRKMMGGGMRQAGMLAAAGLIALRDGPTLLPHDHRRTRELAHALVDAGYDVDLGTVQTNMVYAGLQGAQAKVETWAAQGLLANALDTDRVRFVLHHQISDEQLARAIEVIGAR